MTDPAITPLPPAEQRGLLLAESLPPERAPVNVYSGRVSPKEG